MPKVKKPCESLLVFPYNGNARESLDCLGNQYTFIGFIDDLPEKQGRDSLGREIYSREVMDRFPKAKILAVPGSPESFLKRQALIESLNISPGRFAQVIHPSANISSSAKIGFNTLIMAGVVITSNVIIGNHVCVLPNTVIHHDTVIEDWTLLGAGLVIAGGVIIHENCYIGSGSTIINNIEIGARTLVGLGSNVIKSLPSGVTAVGNPARVFKPNQETK
jgi:sugar O-acyltransferase (sialic acid O-acetyltransferase NeuD family)